MKTTFNKIQAIALALMLGSFFASYGMQKDDKDNADTTKKNDQKDVKSSGNKNLDQLVMDNSVDALKNALATCTHDDCITPLQIAVSKNHQECAELLLRHGASPNGPSSVAGKTMLRSLIEDNNISFANLLIHFGADAKNNIHDTDLFWAIDKGYVACIAFLLRHKVNPNVIEDGETPLHHIVTLPFSSETCYSTIAQEKEEDQRSDIIRLLIEAGADVTQEYTNNQSLQDSSVVQRVTQLIEYTTNCKAEIGKVFMNFVNMNSFDKNLIALIADYFTVTEQDMTLLEIMSEASLVENIMEVLKKTIPSGNYNGSTRYLKGALENLRNVGSGRLGIDLIEQLAEGQWFLCESGKWEYRTNSNRVDKKK